jgi:hypothetical protein
MYEQNIIFNNAIWVSKNAEFDADFKSAEKAVKNHANMIVCRLLFSLKLSG